MFNLFTLFSTEKQLKSIFLIKCLKNNNNNNKQLLRLVDRFSLTEIGNKCIRIRGIFQWADHSPKLGCAIGEKPNEDFDDKPFFSRRAY